MSYFFNAEEGIFKHKAGVSDSFTQRNIEEHLIKEKPYILKLEGM